DTAAEGVSSNAKRGGELAAVTDEQAETSPQGLRSMEEVQSEEGLEDQEEGRGLAALRNVAWYLALLVAPLAGAAHAFMPGHGKSMVAAYLLGTKGRLRDALTLGVASTISHSIGNFAIAAVVIFVAVGIFGMSSHAATSYGSILLEALCGAFVVFMGGAIFYDRLRRYRRGLPAHDHDHGPGGHTHDHAHEHGDAEGSEPDHQHGHGKEENAQGSTVMLGIIAGLQPCTAGIWVSMLSINQGWFWKGLYILVLFSLGLGVILTCVAAGMVLARSYLSQRLETRQSNLLQVLPLVSAVALTTVGGYMIVDCYVRNQQWVHQFFS
ncbi:nickel/cobalt transporter, partial [Planctomycetota bacterium]